MDNKIEQYEKIVNFVKNNGNVKKETLYSEIVNLLYFTFPDMDWVGFYEKDLEKEELYLSFYVGELACEIIKTGNGVCGKCYRDKKTQLVSNVHNIPYHIACSSSTKSEIVVPIIDKENNCFAVLDIDSDKLNAFDEIDQKYLEQIATLLIK